MLAPSIDACTSGQTAAIMVNAGLRKSRSLPVDGMRIEHLVGIHKRELVSRLDLAIEARPAAGVAGRVLLLDAEPNRVLIAIDPHLDDPLGVT